MESATLVSYGIRATRLPSSCPQRTRWTLESFQPICPSCRKWKRWYRSVTCADDGLSIPWPPVPLHRTLCEFPTEQCQYGRSAAYSAFGTGCCGLATTRSSDGDRPEISTPVPFRLSGPQRASNNLATFSMSVLYILF